MIHSAALFIQFSRGSSTYLITDETSMLYEMNMIVIADTDKLLAQVHELQVQFNALHLKQPDHSTSYSEYHGSLQELGLSKINPPKGAVLMKYKPCIKLPFEDITSHIGGEIETVQPYWTEKIQSLNAVLIEAGAEVKFFDSHSIAFFPKSKTKPDIAIIVAGCNSVTTFNTVCVGELKGVNQIDDKALGQLESYLKILLQEQPFRQYAYGFLTDNSQLRVCLACQEYKRTEFEWIVEVPWKDESAVNALSYLVLSSLSQLYYVLPEVDPSIQLINILGRGLSGIVYRGKRNEKDVVVKVFVDEKRCSTELRILEHLQRSGIKNIPTIDGHWEKILALTPIGQSFTDAGVEGPILSLEHVRSLVQILYTAHCSGVVHRDVQPRNIFCVEGKVLLNDWGSACYIKDKKKTYEGWLPGSSDAILSCLLQNRRDPVPVHPKNDLHSLARAIYCILLNPPLSSCADMAYIKEFWKGRGSWWQNIFSLAEQVNVEDEATYKNFVEGMLQVFDVIDMYSWPV